MDERVHRPVHRDRYFQSKRVLNPSADAFTAASMCPTWCLPSVPWTCCESRGGDGGALPAALPCAHDDGVGGDCARHSTAAQADRKLEQHARQAATPAASHHPLAPLRPWQHEQWQRLALQVARVEQRPWHTLQSGAQRHQARSGDGSVGRGRAVVERTVQPHASRGLQQRGDDGGDLLAHHRLPATAACCGLCCDYGGAPPAAAPQRL